VRTARQHNVLISSSVISDRWPLVNKGWTGCLKQPQATDQAIDTPFFPTQRCQLSLPDACVSRWRGQHDTRVHSLSVCHSKRPFHFGACGGATGMALPEHMLSMCAWHDVCLSCHRPVHCNTSAVTYTKLLLAAMSHHTRGSDCSADMQSVTHKLICEELEEEGWDVCWDCGTRTTVGNMDTHLDGRKHQQRLDLTYCDLCNVETNSFELMIDHLSGRRHQVAILGMLSRYCGCRLAEADTNTFVRTAYLLRAHLAGSNRSKGCSRGSQVTSSAVSCHGAEAYTPQHGRRPRGTGGGLHSGSVKRRQPPLLPHHAREELVRWSLRVAHCVVAAIDALLLSTLPALCGRRMTDAHMLARPRVQLYDPQCTMRTQR